MVYLDERGLSDLEESLRIDAGVKAKIDNILLNLSGMNNLGYPLKPLKGNENRGLYELPFEVNNVQYRPLGCYGPARHEFTFLILATKKQGKRRKDTNWYPGSATQVARARTGIIKRDRSRVRDYNYGKTKTAS